MIRTATLVPLALSLCLAACESTDPLTTGTESLPPADPIRSPLSDDALPTYTLSFDNRHTQMLDVELVLPTEGDQTVELMMAVWTPGSYLVREYAQHLNNVDARLPNGTSVPISKREKNRWTMEVGTADQVIVTYQVYAHQLNVRGNWVEPDFASLNGAAVFLVDPRHLASPMNVALRLPESWSSAHTALPRHPDGAAWTYRSPDFDTLVDSPILLGNPAVYPFEVSGVSHWLVNEGEAGVWDGAKSAKDVERITEEQVAFWGSVPYDKYLFLNVIQETGGGLEHKESTLMMTSRWKTSDRQAYIGWLGLVSHEFFHTWNIKRLRPAELGPFDYEQEVYTKSLWVAEGITSYYDELLLRRAGLITEKEYLALLSKQIQKLQRTPGRKVQSLENASFDAWIKHYRQNENSVNSAMSYYTKGAVVGWLLDMEIRQRTGGAKSLDDVMRAAMQRYSGSIGYTPEEFQQTAEAIAGSSLETFFEQYVRGTDELDYQPALDWLGLQFRPPPASGAEKTDDSPKDSDGTDEAEDEETKKGWIGAEMSQQRGRWIVTGLPNDTPAFHSSLIVDDEIIAVNGFRVAGGGLRARLKPYAPGDTVTLLVARRGRILEAEVELGERPAATWSLQSQKAPSKALVKNRSSWLGTHP